MDKEFEEFIEKSLLCLYPNLLIKYGKGLYDISATIISSEDKLLFRYVVDDANTLFISYDEIYKFLHKSFDLKLKDIYQFIYKFAKKHFKFIGGASFRIMLRCSNRPPICVYDLYNYKEYKLNF